MTKKHVLIGVCGGVSAYKACDLVSKLSKLDYEIKVIMTENATKFVPPLIFESLSHNSVEVDLFDPNNQDPITHITLAHWADCVVLVPTTANVIAKVVHGLADDLLTSTFLACTCKKIICPAMNTHMYENQVTQDNLARARQLGYQVFEPVVGHLACDDTGKGKLPDVQDIVEVINQAFAMPQMLKGKKVLITAGPTQEPLDPVRFLSNHSSGKQGYAIGEAAYQMGAQVTIVSGPTSLKASQGIQVIPVQTAQEMFEVVKENYQSADFIIMAAAVADYRPEVVAENKIKKTDENLTIHMVKNPDILAYVGEHKTHQIICGFAMETQDLDENAKAKCIKKNCDILIGNNLFTKGAGFQGDTNVVSFVTQESIQHWPKQTKAELGKKILQAMIEIEKRQ